MHPGRLKASPKGSLVTLAPNSLCYSPNLAETVFSEVRIQHSPATIRLEDVRLSPELLG
jgi:hypothetical protein